MYLYVPTIMSIWTQLSVNARLLHGKSFQNGLQLDPVFVCIQTDFPTELEAKLEGQCVTNRNDGLY